MGAKQAYSLDVHEGFGGDPQSLDTQGECTDYEQIVSASLRLRGLKLPYLRLKGKVQHE